MKRTLHNKSVMDSASYDVHECGRRLAAPRGAARFPADAD